jgi:hypothetical protein
METLQINNSTLGVLNQSEIDVQIATAHRYPRNVQVALDKILSLATTDKETAEDCFYSLPRQNKTIEGISVRLAEIFANCWGNLRSQAQIIDNDGRTITARGVCHDLESNNAISVEVKRSIVDRNGRTYSPDMQVVAGNAACAIAFRNAVLKVIPQAITKKVTDQIKEVSVGRGNEREKTITRLFATFSKIGVTAEQVLRVVGVKNEAELTNDNIVNLRGIWTAIKDGEYTKEELVASITTTEDKKEALRDKKAKSQKAAAIEDAQEVDGEEEKAETQTPEMP